MVCSFLEASFLATFIVYHNLKVLCKTYCYVSCHKFTKQQLWTIYPIELYQVTELWYTIYVAEVMTSTPSFTTVTSGKVFSMATSNTVTLKFHRLFEKEGRYDYQLEEWGNQPHALKLMGRYGAHHAGLIYTIRTDNPSADTQFHARMVCELNDPKLSRAIFDNFAQVMESKDAANEPLVTIEGNRLVFEVEVPLPEIEA